ncbi:hypothetical protein BDZ97DRAFT_542975 [Flammula alnicola]|nr:hypothetical protein BDZ97DRAFT_542975 [Flammula alnicola]
MTEDADLPVEPFNAAHEQNDYEIPWSLWDIIADERIAHFFAHDISELRDAFRKWHPKTSFLRDLKRKLRPIQRLPSTCHHSVGVFSGRVSFECTELFFWMEVGRLSGCFSDNVG